MFEQVLIWFLFFALFYLLLTSFIFLRNRIDLTTLRTDNKQHAENRKISVCIPARNEEKNIGALLASVFNQTYDNYDVHVIDDQSTDKTYQVAEKFKKDHPGKMNLHRGKEKPDGWLGKSWACRQLAVLSNGDILLFLDADTQLAPTALEAINYSMNTDSLDMLTVWPQQLLGTFWERTVIPLIYYALVTMLPVIYVYRSPKWLPKFARTKFSPVFAAACGQCIAITRSAYQQTGGHESVKHEVVEDVELAKKIKRAGLTIRMYHGIGSVSCRMYKNQGEMFEGLRKNFLAGFSYSLPLFITFAIMHLAVFVLPFLTIFISVSVQNSTMFFLSVASIGLILMHRLLLSQWFRWDPLYSFLHPVGVLWFQWLGIVKVADHILGRKTKWKGRNL